MTVPDGKKKKNMFVGPGYFRCVTQYLAKRGRPVTSHTIIKITRAPVRFSLMLLSGILEEKVIEQSSALS